eukprot:TRINITY_DN38517_c0_g1_i1.p1 TRINITY_DN38517_c0_g1~~TRINITY_DN38517_c0_g1_i1.p1  ORF type:complete len:793 (+),score=123.86 TRINITY_DN38517_c0_g1_i1:52-2379(+)
MIHPSSDEIKYFDGDGRTYRWYLDGLGRLCCVVDENAAVVAEALDLSSVPAEWRDQVEDLANRSIVHVQRRMSQLDGCCKPADSPPASSLIEKALTTMSGNAKRDGGETDLLDKAKICTGSKGAESKLPKIEDPVHSGHCTLGRIGFLLLCLTGLVFFIIELAASDQYWADWMTALQLFFVALFVTVFVGGDLFMFDAFKEIVNKMERQLKRLRRHVGFFEGKLNELAAVSDGLGNVCDQMNGDVNATVSLLTDLERLGKLQTVNAVINQFFAADYDGTGRIAGKEADLLLPQVTILWELVPEFDRSRVIEHVRENGLTIHQLSSILDALVEEDQELCAQALEDLIGGQIPSNPSDSSKCVPDTNTGLKADGRNPFVDTSNPFADKSNPFEDAEPTNPFGDEDALNPFDAGDVESGKPCVSKLAEEGRHKAIPPTELLFATSDAIELHVMWDRPEERRPPALRRDEQCHFTAPGENLTNSNQFTSAQPGRTSASEKATQDAIMEGTGKSEDADEEDEDALKPMFTVPTPLPVKRVGPVGCGGNYSIWGKWHLLALVSYLWSFILFIFVAVNGESHNIMLAIVLVGFCCSLVGTGKLIEALFHLRRQLKEFHTENARLESLNNELGQEVGKLQKLKTGVQKLQQLCEGNVEKARDLLRSSNIKIKMEGMAVVTHLFKQADVYRSMELNPQEKKVFLRNLESVFRAVPGFDIERIRAIMGAEHEDLHIDKIKDIMDVVASFQDEKGDKEEVSTKALDMQENAEPSNPFGDEVVAEAQ